MKPSDRKRAFAGGGAILAGAALALLVTLHPQGLRVPAAVAWLAALAFVLAGCMVLAQGSGNRLLQAWLPVALLACMLAPAAWLAFGPGQRACGVASAAGVLRLFGTSSGLSCRLGFGVGAVVGAAILGIAIRHAVRVSRKPRG